MLSRTDRLHHLPLLACIFAGLIAMLTGCKTTEANYRQAYEAAVAQQKESTGLDSTIYSRIRNSATTTRLVVGTDSLPMRTEYIGVTKDGGIDKSELKRYNIVVGQFKQVFNARQMRERLIAGGYDGTFIVHTREPLYYVVVATTDDAAALMPVWEKIRSDKSLVLREPMPFVLRPAHLAR